ncbi:hypothetical protein TRFO_28111 [Tritrichomonas foetus]|uniref:Uncharacterized protein n=1 Tax=Tritrichomonas foetus TaxID=1144522 RepID=A0A1J4JZE8_9EUKA|nr:hypothetical protein TRFO_28111 [Tritrichomonas foetus]|eukprot:OHT04355.1 hypothetical protein TRFO_28111 [Tritrichomonas foetus]
MTNIPPEFFQLLDVSAQPEQPQNPDSDFVSQANQAKLSLLSDLNNITNCLLVISTKDYNSRYFHLCTFLLREFFKFRQNAIRSINYEILSQYAEILHQIIMTAPKYQSVFIDIFCHLPKENNYEKYIVPFIQLIQQSLEECLPNIIIPGNNSESINQANSIFSQLRFALKIAKGVQSFLSDHNYEETLHQYIKNIIQVTAPLLIKPAKNCREYLICKKIMRRYFSFPRTFVNSPENSNTIFELFYTFLESVNQVQFNSANEQNIDSELYINAVKYFEVSIITWYQLILHFNLDPNYTFDKNVRNHNLQTFIYPNVPIFLSFLENLVRVFPLSYQSIGTPILSMFLYYHKELSYLNYFPQILELCYNYSKLQPSEFEDFETSPTTYFLNNYPRSNALSPKTSRLIANSIFQLISREKTVESFTFIFNHINSIEFEENGLFLLACLPKILVQYDNSENALSFCHSIIGNSFNLLNTRETDIYMKMTIFHFLANSVPIMNETQQTMVLSLANYLVNPLEQLNITPIDQIRYTFGSEIITDFLVYIKKPIPNEIVASFLRYINNSFSCDPMNTLKHLSEINPELLNDQSFTVINQCLYQLDKIIESISMSDMSSADLINDTIETTMECIALHANHRKDNFPTYEVINRITLLLKNDQIDEFPSMVNFFCSIARSLNNSYQDALTYCYSLSKKDQFSTFMDNLMEPFIILVSLHPTEFMNLPIAENIINDLFTTNYLTNLFYPIDRYCMLTLLARIIQLGIIQQRSIDVLNLALSLITYESNTKSEDYFIAFELIASLTVTVNEPFLTNSPQILEQWIQFCVQGYATRLRYYRILHGCALQKAGSLYSNGLALQASLLLMGHPDQIPKIESEADSYNSLYCDIPSPVEQIIFPQSKIPFVEFQEEYDDE